MSNTTDRTKALEAFFLTFEQAHIVYEGKATTADVADYEAYGNALKYWEELESERSNVQLEYERAFRTRGVSGPIQL